MKTERQQDQENVERMRADNLAAAGGVRERDLLAEAIAQAGIKCGLLRPDIEGLTGPQLLMVCQDMADALSSHRQAGDELPNQKAVELLRELRTARPLLLYGDAWIERIDSVLALVEKEV